MYAIVQSGNRQYRAEPGKYLRVEKLDKKLGEKFDLEQVLIVGGDNPLVGTPIVKNAKVSVVVTQQTRGPKIIIFKKKRRHGYRRLNGHRQPFTELFVLEISAGGKSVEAEAKPVIVDPAKKAERIAKFQEQLAGTTKTERKAKKVAKATKKAAAAAATAKKKAVSKKAPKKAKVAKKKAKKTK